MKMEVHSGLREQLVRIILPAFLFWLESEYQEWAASTFYKVHTVVSACSAAFIWFWFVVLFVCFFFFKNKINWECVFLLLLSDTMLTFVQNLVHKTRYYTNKLGITFPYSLLPRQISYQHDRYSASIIELAVEAICPHGTLVIFFPE